MIPPRIIIVGDDYDGGIERRPDGLLELSKLKTNMGFRGLMQDKRTTMYDDGTIIECHSVFGQDTVIIRPPAIAPQAAVAEVPLPPPYCLVTQNLCQIAVPGFGVNNGVVTVGGEVLGLLPGGLIAQQASNPSLKIESLGGIGTFYVNNIEISNNTWTFGKWGSKTGWPKSWAIEFTACEAAPQLKVSQVGEEDYGFRPYYISANDYNTYNNANGNYQWVWEVLLSPPHPCSGGGQVTLLDWNYTRTGIIVGGFIFQIYLDGGRMMGDTYFSDNWVAGVKTAPATMIYNGAQIPSYNTGCAGFQDPAMGAGEVNGPPWLSAMVANNTWCKKCFNYRYATYNMMQWYWSYEYSGDSWENDGQMCPEDSGVTPELCQIPEQENLNDYGNPPNFSQLEMVFHIKGSPLESIFKKRGFQLVERQFGLTVLGVDKRVLS